MWNILKLLAVLMAIAQVKGDNCPYDGTLVASKTGSITIFNQSLQEPYDRVFNSFEEGMTCTWTIKTEDVDKIVRLNFISFHLKNSTVSRSGDCVDIYDGDKYATKTEDPIAELCDKMPAKVYNSTNSHLSVVFRQGTLGGRRWIAMNYTMVASPDEQETSVIGGIISAGVVLFIAVVFVSVIFSCLKNCFKNHDTCEPLRQLVSCCHEGLSSLFKECGFHSSSNNSHARSDPSTNLQIRRSSMCSELTTEGERDCAVTIEMSSVHPELVEGDEADIEAEQGDPSLPPPSYFSVAQTPSDPQPPPCLPSAPPMSVAASPEDGERGGVTGVPPPSYESLFQGESKA